MTEPVGGSVGLTLVKEQNKPAPRKAGQRRAFSPESGIREVRDRHPVTRLSLHRERVLHSPEQSGNEKGQK